MNPCGKCGGTTFFYRMKGDKTGRYCSNCQAYQSWISKRDRQMLINRGVHILSEGATPFGNKPVQQPEQPQLKEALTACGQCGCTETTYAYKGDKLGRYCKKCLKWQTWVKKTHVAGLTSRGIPIYNYHELVQEQQQAYHQETAVTEHIYNEEKVNYLMNEDELPDFDYLDKEDEEGLTPFERDVLLEHEKEEGLKKAIDCVTCTSGVLAIESKNPLVALQFDADSKLLIVSDTHMMKVYGHVPVHFCPTCGRRL